MLSHPLSVSQERVKTWISSSSPLLRLSTSPQSAPTFKPFIHSPQYIAMHPPVRQTITYVPQHIPEAKRRLARRKNMTTNTTFALSYNYYPPPLLVFSLSYTFSVTANESISSWGRQQVLIYDGGIRSKEKETRTYTKKQGGAARD